ncbi:MAG TPA: hypothetical protein VLT33_39890 [Labilithrix sp.]|nr:hypothetical protein [Labilithrix sp.]
MSHPITPQGPAERKPGRSFEDHDKALGQELLDRSPQLNTAANEDFRPREAQADMPENGIAERAKVVAVLRKAEELIATANPPAEDEGGLRRCFELAAGRVGLTFPEYEALLNGDAELLALEKKVLDAARAQFKA